MTDLYLTKQLRLIEQVNAQRLAPGTLMQRAGQAAANWLAGRMPARTASFLVLCGPGQQRGRRLRVCPERCANLAMPVSAGHPMQPPRATPARCPRSGRRPGGETSKELPRHGRFDVVVDAMFGIGLSRSLSGPYLEASRWANQSGAQVVSLDVPSGLDSDSGVWVGEVAGVRASATLTFLGDKPGLHMSDGCDGAGTVYVEPLGIEPGPSPGHLNGPEHFAAILRPRDRNSHKGHFGSVAVIGGEIGMIGATLLAGRAALRMGAGRVYVCCVGDPDMRVDPVCPELMFRPLRSIAARPGRGDRMRTRNLRAIAARALACIVDRHAARAGRRRPEPGRPGPACATGTGPARSGQRVDTTPAGSGPSAGRNA